MSEPFWNAKQGALIQCPVKNCGHVGVVITKAHCRIMHGMTRAEIEAEYGLPNTVSKLNRKQIEKLKKEGAKSTL